MALLCLADLRWEEAEFPRGSCSSLGLGMGLSPGNNSNQCSKALAFDVRRLNSMSGWCCKPE